MHVLRSTGLRGLDRRVASYLGRTPGVFVEAGANDGIDQSNTFFLERFRQWHGLLIEPVPELAELCRYNRPNSIVESVALVPFGFPLSHVTMRYCNLMSVVKGSMKSETEELEHVRKGAEMQGIEIREIDVDARTLTWVLDKHDIRAVDFLSLDVEGSELAVLKGLDFDRYRPSFMLIEARYRGDIDGFLRPLYEPMAELSHHDVLYKSAKPLEGRGRDLV
jgi:FkbM family methyltransferase